MPNTEPVKTHTVTYTVWVMPEQDSEFEERMTVHDYRDAVYCLEMLTDKLGYWAAALKGPFYA